VGGLPTAFRASSGRAGGPTIAILAEYDALPGIGHGCGHNIIGTSAAAASLALHAAWPDPPGRVIVLGTPAEEAGGGKIDLSGAGVFRDVDAALMVHPSNRTQVEADVLAMPRSGSRSTARRRTPRPGPGRAPTRSTRW
jgi:metal-dependent amidase/aminoacylase/carboxypeptidase family protein